MQKNILLFAIGALVFGISLTNAAVIQRNDKDLDTAETAQFGGGLSGLFNQFAQGTPNGYGSYGQPAGLDQQSFGGALNGYGGYQQPAGLDQQSFGGALNGYGGYQQPAGLDQQSFGGALNGYGGYNQQPGLFQQGFGQSGYGQEINGYGRR